VSRSLHAGVAAVDHDAPGVCIVLADDPLAALALPDVLRAASTAPSSLAAVARTPPVPHPVYVPRAMFDVMPVAGDRGLGALLRERPVDWLHVDAPEPIDVDLPEHVVAVQAAIGGFARSIIDSKRADRPPPSRGGRS
jgi:molybdenum cofactor cytidylyltransferase